MYILSFLWYNIREVIRMRKFLLILSCLLLFSCTTAEEIEVTETTTIVTEIVEEIPFDGTRITDINDFDKLVMPLDMSFGEEVIRAFLDNDTDKLEDLAFLPRGMYADYKTLVIGDYEIVYEQVEEFWTILHFNFEITESGMDTLPVGKYTTRVEDGMHGRAFIYIRETEEINSPVYDTVRRWFGTCVNYIITPDLIAEMSDSMRGDISETVMSLMPKSEDGHPLEDIQACAEKYFGISGFAPGLAYDNGKYYVAAHGGESWVYTIVNADNSTVNVQFFADYMRTVKSHLVAYKIEEIEGQFVIKDCQILEESQYEPYHVSI